MSLCGLQSLMLQGIIIVFIYKIICRSIIMPKGCSALIVILMLLVIISGTELNSCFGSSTEICDSRLNFSQKVISKS